MIVIWYVPAGHEELEIEPTVWPTPCTIVLPPGADGDTVTVVPSTFENDCDTV